jgi:hypothetical protein
VGDEKYVCTGCEDCGRHDFGGACSRCIKGYIPISKVDELIKLYQSTQATLMSMYGENHEIFKMSKLFIEDLKKLLEKQ